MREIEFRGLDVNGNWFYGLLAVGKKDHGDGQTRTCISNSAGSPWAYQVRPETVGEYTGMEDDNAVKVFEDDIAEVVIIDTGGRCTVRRAKIRMSDEGCWMCGMMYIWAAMDCVGFLVIGNVHQNPELLETEQ